MKYCLKTLFGALVLLVSLSAHATTYYVSDCQTGAVGGCLAGSDAANGTSTSSPWQTLAKVATVVNSMPAGSSILFARGSSLASATGLSMISNLNSVHTNPILFSDYGPSWYAGLQKPIITLTAVSTGVHLLDFEDGGNADHDEGYTVSNLDLRGSGFGVGIFIYNDVDYLTITNCSISAFTIGMQGAGSNTTFNAGSDGVNSFITLSNSSLTANTDQGFLGYANDLVIDGCTFDGNGFAQALLDHNLYIGSAHDGHYSNGIRIRNNILKHASVIGGKCSSVSLVMHGSHLYSVIENNLVQEDLGGALAGCYGISVDPGYLDTTEDFSNTIIRNNRIVNVGAIGIGAASCPNCLIENNSLYQNQSGIGYTGIVIPDRVRPSGDIADNAATVQSNSITIGPSVTTWIGVQIGTEGTGYVITRNAIYYTGTTNGNTCVSHPLADASYASLLYNLCYCPSATCL